MGAVAVLPTPFGRPDMASKKTTTNNSIAVNGVPAVTDAATPTAGAEATATGRKLRWTSLKAADGVAHRTKKPKAPKSATSKAGSKGQETEAKAGKLSALDAAAKVLQ